MSLQGKRVWIAGHRGMVGAALMRRLQGEDCTLLTAGRAELDLRRQADTEAWIERTGIVPINHVLTVRNELLESHSWLAGELMELFEEARRVAIEEDGATPPPAYGLEENRRSLQLAFDYSADQKVTPRRYEVDELFVRI